MLKFNLKKVFLMKGITRPMAHFMHCGINRGMASKLARNQVKHFDAELIEKICLGLECVPHDFMEWYPDSPSQKEQPLKILIPKQNKVRDLKSLMKNLPLEKFDELAKKAEELKKEETI